MGIRFSIALVYCIECNEKEMNGDRGMELPDQIRK